MNFLQVKNWQQFQHYKHRNPPWIKLHFEILSSADWVMLSDASKLLAVACMLIASRNNGLVPDDAHYMKRVAYLEKLPNFKPLIECGFLINLQADASDCKHMRTNADTETETETETEKIVRLEAPQHAPAARAKTTTSRGTRLPADWQPSPEASFFAETAVGADFVRGELDKFRDYWLSVPGHRGCKLDWDRTWKNWCRNAGGNFNGRRGEKSLRQRTADALQRLGSGEIGEIADFGLPKLDHH